VEQELSYTDPDYNVTFRFVGKDVEPELLTKKLELQPTRSHSRGGVLPRHPERKYPFGLWAIDSSLPKTQHLEAHLNELLKILEPRSERIRSLTAMGTRGEFYCGAFCQEKQVPLAYIELGADLLRRISDLPASIIINVYE
jgi:hypothetical protein